MVDKDKAELVKAIKDAGLAPDEEIVIQGQHDIDALIRALRNVAMILEAKRDTGYRLIRHSDFVAYINK